MKPREKRSFVFGALFALVLLATGCGASLMHDTTPLPPPTPDYAIVNFVRPSAYAWAVDYPLWDGETFIGNIGPEDLLQWKAKPGDHLFIAVGENHDYTKATIEGGRSYYIQVKAYPGFWSASVGFAPVHKNDSSPSSAEIQKWMTKLGPESADPVVAAERQASGLKDIQKHIQEYNAGQHKGQFLAVDDWR